MTQDVDVVTLDQSLGGEVLQNNAREVSRPLFFNQERRPKRNTGVASKETVQRRRSRRRGWAPVEA